jgi:hypothetical protein
VDALLRGGDYFRLASRHSRLADLAVAFPGLLLALSVPGPGLEPRHPIDLVIADALPWAMAATAGLPLWVCRLPSFANSSAETLIYGWQRTLSYVRFWDGNASISYR